jgi:hypothetical protein
LGGRVRKWTLVALGSAAVLLVPWMVVLARTLPADTQVRHWSLAWVGLDVLLTAGCAATSLLGLRGSPHARLTASATAAAAVLDAWFDLTTAQPGAALVQAAACAVAEAALAGTCVCLALGRVPTTGPAAGSAVDDRRTLKPPTRHKGTRT